MFDALLGFVYGMHVPNVKIVRSLATDTQTPTYNWNILWLKLSVGVHAQTENIRYIW